MFCYAPSVRAAHLQSLKSATATLPYAICMAVCAIIGSVIVQKSGRYKWALVLGSAVSAVGAGIMYTLNPTSSFAKIAGFEVSNPPLRHTATGTDCAGHCGRGRRTGADERCL